MQDHHSLLLVVLRNYMIVIHKETHITEAFVNFEWVTYYSPDVKTISLDIQRKTLSVHDLIQQTW